MLSTKFEKYLEVKKGAIHIGANEGQERDWYRNQAFNKVLWFEPNTVIYEKLVKNIKNYPGQIAFNLGIHDSLKETKLHISSNNGESSSILDLGLHKQYHPNVHYVKDEMIVLTRMDLFFKDYENIDDYNFLNIDVQGVELNVIKSFGSLLNKIDYIYVEVNEAELYIDCSLLPDIDKYLANFGFIRLATYMTKSKWGDAFYKKYI
jgi:FkbM family methyltransferase